MISYMLYSNRNVIQSRTIITCVKERSLIIVYEGRVRPSEVIALIQLFQFNAVGSKLQVYARSSGILRVNVSKRLCITRLET